MSNSTHHRRKEHPCNTLTARYEYTRIRLGSPRREVRVYSYSRYTAGCWQTMMPLVMIAQILRLALASRCFSTGLTRVKFTIGMPRFKFTIGIARVSQCPAVKV